MEYASTLLAVKDMEASKAFYTGLMGMKVTQDFGANITFDNRLSLQTLETWAEFLDADQADIRFGGGQFEVYFEEEDLDGFLHLLETEWPQVELAHGVKEFPWGQRGLRLYDPDHHLVEVGESMKTVIKRCLCGMSDEDTQVKCMYPLAYVRMCRRELEEETKA